MKKINIVGVIIFAAVIVVISMIIALTEGNYLMLKQITKGSSSFVTFIKGFGFSIAALVIIVYDKRKVVKIMFVILDTAMIFCLQYFESQTWKGIGAFIYAPYTGLNLYFIGMIVANELAKYLNENKNNEALISLKNQLHKTQYELEITQEKLLKTKSKLSEMLHSKLINVKRGRGEGKEDRIKGLEQEIKEYINEN